MYSGIISEFSDNAAIFIHDWLTDQIKLRQK
jgi:hypothetical protein